VRREACSGRRTRGGAAFGPAPLIPLRRGVGGSPASGTSGTTAFPSPRDSEWKRRHHRLSCRRGYACCAPNERLVRLSWRTSVQPRFASQVPPRRLPAFPEQYPLGVAEGMPTASVGMAHDRILAAPRVCCMPAPPGGPLQRALVPRHKETQEPGMSIFFTVRVRTPTPAAAASPAAAAASPAEGGRQNFGQPRNNFLD
jgi:hypothetical protein